MSNGDGYRCELCGFEAGSHERFLEHESAHRWRENYRSLRTALNESDKIFLKLQRIAAESQNDDPAVSE